MSRLCRIEVNRTGLWHAVAEFDLAAPAAEATARSGVEALASLDAATAFRLVDVATGRTVVSHSFARGWTLSRAAAAKATATGSVDCGECPLITTGCESGHCLKARA